MTNQQTTNRRSRWQVQAAKRYPRFLHVGGDGGVLECFVVLTRCPHEQTTCWRYCLRPTKADAELLLASWSIQGCGYKCQGTHEHTIWKLT